MEVRCPKCQSRFNLPDSVLKPNSRLRCSVCKEVFVLEEQRSAPVNMDLEIESTEKDSPTKKKRNIIVFLIALLVLLCAGGYGAYKYFTPPQQVAPTGKELAKKVEYLTMRNVRQYYVNNEKVGKIFVIEGKVVNGFPEPRELIQVEASIYGPQDKVIAAKTQLAGTVLSLFQLQVLGEKELESFLNNKIEILTNNTNIPSGGEVPFMIVFYNTPADVAEFVVKIVDVKEVEKTDAPSR